MALVNEQFARTAPHLERPRARVPGTARVQGRQGRARRAQDDHGRHHLRVAMDIASHAARKLARRSSRRQFFKLLGAGSLGAGLFLTRTDVSLGAITGCVGCGGGPCNPCFSPVARCETPQPAAPVPDLPGRAAAARPAARTGGEWFCCLTSGARARLPVPLLGVHVPARLPEPVPATASPTSPCPASRGGTPAISPAPARRPSEPKIGTLAA